MLVHFKNNRQKTNSIHKCNQKTYKQFPTTNNNKKNQQNVFQLVLTQTILFLSSLPSLSLSLFLYHLLVHDYHLSNEKW